ncbi:MAG TPA: LTA synthase family protein [Pseudogracilibacillus sp.]|nr:LTA synthase family protein [Pseudogracilibacillus sp.]
MHRDLRNVPLFLLATVLFGLKSYIVYRFLLQIEINSFLQEIIIFINPFITSFIFFGLTIWFTSEEHRRLFIRYSVLVGTLIIYVNLLFYRSFTDFLTIPQIVQMSNVSDLTSSILSLLRWYDPLLFLDLIIIWYVARKTTIGRVQTFTRKMKMFAIVISLLLLSVNFLLAEMERPQLLSRGFDREYLVKNIGLFYFHLYDVVLQSKMHTQRVLADDHDLKEIKQYIHNEVRSNRTSPLFGQAKDRNIIFISAESIQSFVIGETLHGEEITPFLNRLVKDEDTFYFENFYHQTAQGKTSDSEFLTENSLYPLPGGAVFFTHAQNDYYAMPEMLKQRGYESVVFHANSESFWNRNQMYESFEIDTFYDVSYYDAKEEDEVGWGLKDKLFFTQSVEYMRDLDEPFYAKLITLTNHFPFELDESDRTLEPYDSNSQTLNNYFPTVRYTDEAIEQFFMELKLADLYDNSIIVIMGDHDGISANHNKAMAQFLDQETIDPYDYFQLQRVPLFIHIPGYVGGEVKETISGQIDLKPTLLHLVGIDTSHDLYFGNDLFSPNRKGYIIQRNGDFVTDHYIYTNDTCYERETGEVIGMESTLMEEETPCDEWRERVELELHYSDQIIYGDLFRFVDFEAK